MVTITRSQVVHLSVYHMMTEEEGRNGFFRWNDHICTFIKNNWSRLLPYRKKTGSWQSTVAGVLSQFSPSIFKSGTVHHYNKVAAELYSWFVLNLFLELGLLSISSISVCMYTTMISKVEYRKRIKFRGV